MQTRRSGFLFVTKISKFCNLRCTYCYEFDELANTQRMSLDQLRAFFIHVADAAQRYGRNSLHFVWHGGEPLLIPLDYYEQIGQMQREIFPSGIEVANFVQTNLTVLTDRHLTWLKEKRFFAQGLGVSFDVYGDQRVDRRGRLRTEAVLANLQRLKDAEIRFGAITVLARNTLPRIREIFTFYESLGISFRLLPFYKSAYDAQVRDHALGLSEIADAFKAVFDAWWVSERPMSIQPLDEYLLYALAVLRDTPKWFHDPDAEEYVFLVDTDGSTYGQADTYVRGRAYGNVFDQNFATLLDSPTRKQGVREARARLNDHCASCPYYGHCPGIFAAEASAEQRRMLRTEGCQVREVIGHMVQRLADTEVGQRIARAGRD